MKQGKSYGELLRDPRWQRKRLKILERDGFECQDCGSADKELHVHHTKYLRGAAPWESADIDLLTLCETCHRSASLLRRRLLDLVDELDPFRLGPLVGYAIALCSEDLPERPGYEDMDYEIVSGFADHHLMAPEEVIGLIGKDGRLQKSAAESIQAIGLARRRACREAWQRRRNGAA